MHKVRDSATNKRVLAEFLRSLGSSESEGKRMRTALGAISSARMKYNDLPAADELFTDKTDSSNVFVNWEAFCGSRMKDVS
jgi:hypothetical protein